MAQSTIVGHENDPMTELLPAALVIVIAALRLRGIVYYERPCSRCTLGIGRDLPVFVGT